MRHPPASVEPLDSAVAVGRRLGLRVEAPVVLRYALNLVVHLAPAPVVARVAYGTALVRGAEPLADSLALAAFLVSAGLPIGAPATVVDPGPHVGPGGWRMTLWDWLEVLPEEPDPFEVGRTLRTLHDAAAGFRGPLRHVGPLEEAERLLDLAADRRPVEAAQIRRAATALRLPSLSVQPLHGDAHLGNVVQTALGLRWLDWEESWRGPVGWDLACMAHRARVFGELEAPIAAALAGYGPFDEAAVDAFGDVVAVWAAAWGVLIAAESGEISDSTRRRLEWLAERTT